MFDILALHSNWFCQNTVNKPFSVTCSQKIILKSNVNVIIVFCTGSNNQRQRNKTLHTP